MSCEKCWSDAYREERFGPPTLSQADHYKRLLEERKDTPCTLEQQCGVGTTEMHTILATGKCACGRWSEEDRDGK